MDVAEYTIKPNNRYLKQGQYSEYLFNEPYENGNQSYKQSTIYKRCDVILHEDKYKNLKSIYRKQEIPIDKWKELLREFYIEVDDYLAKGILDVNMCVYLIDTFIIKRRYHK
jgi:hypothetical protein